MNEIFQLGPVDVGWLVGRDDFDIGQQKSRIEFRVCDPCFDFVTGNADLVQHIRCSATTGLSDLLRST